MVCAVGLFECRSVVYGRSWFHAAGFAYDNTLHDMPDDVWDIMQKVHVRAPFRLIRDAAPHMRIKVRVSLPYHRVLFVVLMMCQGDKENRSIVNVSSTAGLHGRTGRANYAAAKAAIIGLTKSVAKEWGPFGVRANTIAFGLVHTRSAF